ncbi:hypothetical protein PR048_003269 [Dryococelus australis]|uniref:Uncharacterized protein n=1 Tax=Dryococelus australis TaxID=614101 RepID=A0ABQ9IMK4_9NEOP|nr:hypothetical protein PR048_003269 [Dryococelus australis]
MYFPIAHFSLLSNQATALRTTLPRAQERQSCWYLFTLTNDILVDITPDTTGQLSATMTAICRCPKAIHDVHFNHSNFECFAVNVVKTTGELQRIPVLFVPLFPLTTVLLVHTTPDTFVIGHLSARRMPSWQCSNETYKLGPRWPRGDRFGLPPRGRYVVPAGPLQDVRMLKTWRTLPEAGGFSRGAPVFPRPLLVRTSHDVYWPLKAVHGKVSTFEVNLTKKKSLLLPAYILTGALSDMRPVKLVTMEGKTLLMNICFTMVYPKYGKSCQKGNGLIPRHVKIIVMPNNKAKFADDCCAGTIFGGRTTVTQLAARKSCWLHAFPQLEFVDVVKADFQIRARTDLITKLASYLAAVISSVAVLKCSRGKGIIGDKGGNYVAGLSKHDENTALQFRAATAHLMSMPISPLTLPRFSVLKKMGLAVLGTRPFVLREYVYVDALGRLDTIDPELQCQTVSPDFVIIGFSGLLLTMVANLKDVLTSKIAPASRGLVRGVACPMSNCTGARVLLNCLQWAGPGRAPLLLIMAAQALFRRGQRPPSEADAPAPPSRLPEARRARTQAEMQSVLIARVIVVRCYVSYFPPLPASWQSHELSRFSLTTPREEGYLVAFWPGKWNVSRRAVSGKCNMKKTTVQIEKPSITSLLQSRPMRMIEVNMERHHNEGAGENGRSPRKPADQRHPRLALFGGKRANHSATVARVRCGTRLRCECDLNRLRACAMCVWWLGVGSRGDWRLFRAWTNISGRDSDKEDVGETPGHDGHGIVLFVFMATVVFETQMCRDHNKAGAIGSESGTVSSARQFPVHRPYLPCDRPASRHLCGSRRKLCRRDGIKPSRTYTDCFVALQCWRRLVGRYVFSCLRSVSGADRERCEGKFHQLPRRVPGSRLRAAYMPSLVVESAVCLGPPAHREPEGYRATRVSPRAVLRVATGRQAVQQFPADTAASTFDELIAEVESTENCEVLIVFSVTYQRPPYVDALFKSGPPLERELRRGEMSYSSRSCCCCKMFCELFKQLFTTHSRESFDRRRLFMSVCSFDRERERERERERGERERERESSGEVWVAVNYLVVGGDEGEAREIPEKTRLPVASSGTIPTCENPGVTRLGIEPGSPWWDASSLTTQPPRPVMYPAITTCKRELYPGLMSREIHASFKCDSCITPALDIICVKQKDTIANCTNSNMVQLIQIRRQHYCSERRALQPPPSLRRYYTIPDPIKACARSAIAAVILASMALAMAFPALHGQISYQICHIAVQFQSVGRSPWLLQLETSDEETEKKDASILIIHPACRSLYKNQVWLQASCNIGSRSGDEFETGHFSAVRLCLHAIKGYRLNYVGIIVLFTINFMWPTHEYNDETHGNVKPCLHSAVPVNADVSETRRQVTFPNASTWDTAAWDSAVTSEGHVNQSAHPCPKTQVGIAHMKGLSSECYELASDLASRQGAPLSGWSDAADLWVYQAGAATSMAMVGVAALQCISVRGDGRLCGTLATATCVELAILGASCVPRFIGSGKDETATHIEYVVDATRRSLDWRAVLSHLQFVSGKITAEHNTPPALSAFAVIFVTTFCTNVVAVLKLRRVIPAVVSGSNSDWVRRTSDTFQSESCKQDASRELKPSVFFFSIKHGRTIDVWMTS